MKKKQYYITVPNKSFSGKRYGVQFYKGQANAELTEKEALDMKNDGYEVGEVNGPEDKSNPAEQKSVEEKIEMENTESEKTPKGKNKK